MNEPIMPSVTPGPIIGLAAAALSVAAAFGLHITNEQSIALLGLGTALGVAIPAIEAWLRRGRLAYHATVHAARITSDAHAASLTSSTTPKD